MPLAQLKGLSGLLSAEQKGKLIRKVTEALVVGQFEFSYAIACKFYNRFYGSWPQLEVVRY